MPSLISGFCRQTAARGCVCVRACAPFPSDGNPCPLQHAHRGISPLCCTCCHYIVRLGGRSELMRCCYNYTSTHSLSIPSTPHPARRHIRHIGVGVFASVCRERPWRVCILKCFVRLVAWHWMHVVHPRKVGICVHRSQRGCSQSQRLGDRA